MKPELLQTLSQIAILIGIIVTALGGFGSYHFGKKADRIKEEKNINSEKELSQQVAELINGNRKLEKRLEPFEDLASKAYPGIEKDAALGRLSREIEELRGRATKIETQTQPRRLTESQKSEIAKSLRERGKGKTSIVSVMGDQEAFQFAQDLKAALEMGGWVVDGVSQAVFSGPIIGVLIKVGADPPPKEVLWLFEALKSGGVHSEGSLNKQISPNAFELLIGSKK